MPLPRIMSRKACATSGSNCAPAFLSISRSASSTAWPCRRRGSRSSRRRNRPPSIPSPAAENLLALEAPRVALAVPALVVGQDVLRDVDELRRRLRDPEAHLRVPLDLLPLRLVQRGALGQDVLVHADLADVCCSVESSSSATRSSSGSFSARPSRFESCASRSAWASVSSLSPAWSS